ncbi:MAG: NnrU family protein [Sphingomicrobium sp.]
MTGLAALALSCAAFVGTHFAMSHPLRAPMVSALGERGFSIAYSIVSLVTFYGMVHYYHPAFAQSPAVLWDSGITGWVVGTVLMWIGSILFVGSIRSNPAFPTGGKPVSEIGEARGVFAITRHPMMWAFAIWAAVHVLVNPTPASIVVGAAIAILALGGAAGQDRKKAKLIGEPWRDWETRTSFLPFGRGLASPGSFALIGGTLLWLAATYAHGALGYRPAGLWAFFA